MVNRRIIDQTEATSLSGDDYLVADNANLGTRKIQFTRLLSGATPLPPDYLTGFKINIYSNTSISVSNGYVRSSDNLRNIQLSTNLIKNISSTFDLGNNTGCMPSGLTLQANKKYYIFAISTSGGQTDIIVDTDENCSNGLVDNVVVLNNFDKFAKIGYLTTNSNSLIKFVFYDTLSSDRVDYIIDQQLPTAQNNYTWYRLYKSGWVEQGGYNPSALIRNEAFLQTLPIPMANTNYQVALNFESRNQTYHTGNNLFLLSDNYTTTTFVYYGRGGDNNTYKVSSSWEVKGVSKLI